ncbi:MAG: hypothetical protein ACOCTT_03955, partial [archaeon]
YLSEDEVALMEESFATMEETGEMEMMKEAMEEMDISVNILEEEIDEEEGTATVEAEISLQMEYMGQSMDETEVVTHTLMKENGKWVITGQEGTDPFGGL